jgi:hypothetical protein
MSFQINYLYILNSQFFIKIVVWTVPKQIIKEMKNMEKNIKMMLVVALFCLTMTTFVQAVGAFEIQIQTGETPWGGHTYWDPGTNQQLKERHKTIYYNNPAEKVDITERYSRDGKLSERIEQHYKQDADGNWVLDYEILIRYYYDENGNLVKCIVYKTNYKEDGTQSDPLANKKYYKWDPIQGIWVEITEREWKQLNGTCPPI